MAPVLRWTGVLFNLTKARVAIEVRCRQNINKLVTLVTVFRADSSLTVTKFNAVHGNVVQWHPLFCIYFPVIFRTV